MPGGTIDLNYLPDETDVAAAHPGDYIYPIDVRLDTAAERLFVLANGYGLASDKSQTWLFEFDLNTRKEMAREQLNPKVLPPPCAAL